MPVVRDNKLMSFSDIDDTKIISGLLIRIDITLINGITVGDGCGF